MLTYAGIPSDTLTISDQTAYLDNQDISKGAWLLLAYADWSRYAHVCSRMLTYAHVCSGSSECWELAEAWEKRMLTYAHVF
jgi:hypothetical protein